MHKLYVIHTNTILKSNFEEWDIKYFRNVDITLPKSYQSKLYYELFVSLVVNTFISPVKS